MVGAISLVLVFKNKNVVLSQHTAYMQLLRVPRHRSKAVDVRSAEIKTVLYPFFQVTVLIVAKHAKHAYLRFPQYREVGLKGEGRRANYATSSGDGWFERLRTITLSVDIYLSCPLMLPRDSFCDVVILHVSSNSLPYQPLHWFPFLKELADLREVTIKRQRELKVFKQQ